MKSLHRAIAKLDGRLTRSAARQVVEDLKVFNKSLAAELSEVLISKRLDHDLGSPVEKPGSNEAGPLATDDVRDSTVSFSDFFSDANDSHRLDSASMELTVSFDDFLQSALPSTVGPPALPDERRAGIEQSAAETVHSTRASAITMPLKTLKARRMVTPDEPKSAVSEEFRRIKRPVMSYAAKSAGSGASLANIIMVTSCIEGEGKTTTAMNLAMSIAMEREKTVLLIDADVEKATASTLLGFSRADHGLTDLLKSSTLQAAEVICRSDVDNFHFMPSGTYSDHSTELLASIAMRSLLAKLSKRYPNRVIIMDAPPVLLTSEAIALAEQVGQILFVVAAETTRHGMVLDALSRIKGAAKTGLVLNKMQKTFGALNGYGYSAVGDVASQVAENGAR